MFISKNTLFFISYKGPLFRFQRLNARIPVDDDTSLANLLWYHRQFRNCAVTFEIVFATIIPLSSRAQDLESLAEIVGNVEGYSNNFLFIVWRQFLFFEELPKTLHEVCFNTEYI